MLNLFFLQCIERASFSVWLYRFSVRVIVRLMKWTGWKPLPVSRNNPAESPSRKLASTLTRTGLAGLKYAAWCVHLLCLLSASQMLHSPLLPISTFVSLWVSPRKGAGSDAYLWLNFDRYPVMPRNLLTASFGFGWLLCFTALIFSGFGFNPSFVNLCP